MRKLPRRPDVRASMRDGRADWYRIENVADSSNTVSIYIYDEIGYWGVTAADFVRELTTLRNVEKIELHLNSPGGDVFDGLAILNALRQHPAEVVATVDGLAASAASFILQAGSERVMARNTELMIHDASGLGVGNAELMRDLADRLDAVSDNIADIYSERAGGTREEWRTAMQAESWYSPEEALAAGLIDRVLDAPESAGATNRFDLSFFSHAGRADAPAPVVPETVPATVQPIDWAALFHGAFEEASR